MKVNARWVSEWAFLVPPVCLLGLVWMSAKGRRKSAMAGGQALTIAVYVIYRPAGNSYVGFEQESNFPNAQVAEQSIIKLFP